MEKLMAILTIDVALSTAFSAMTPIWTSTSLLGDPTNFSFAVSTDDSITAVNFYNHHLLK